MVVAVITMMMMVMMILTMFDVYVHGHDIMVTMILLKLILMRWR